MKQLTRVDIFLILLLLRHQTTLRYWMLRDQTLPPRHASRPYYSFRVGGCVLFAELMPDFVGVVAALLLTLPAHSSDWAGYLLVIMFQFLPLFLILLYHLLLPTLLKVTKDVAHTHGVDDFEEVGYQIHKKGLRQTRWEEVTHKEDYLWQTILLVKVAVKAHS